MINNDVAKTQYVDMLLKKARQCGKDTMKSVALFDMGKMVYYQGNKDIGYVPRRPMTTTGASPSLPKKNDYDNYLIMSYLFNRGMYDKVISLNTAREKQLAAQDDTVTYQMASVKKFLARAYQEKGNYGTGARAAIGAGRSGKCGNITIENSTITAKAGNFFNAIAAVIGSGGSYMYDASCGDIMITLKGESQTDFLNRLTPEGGAGKVGVGEPRSQCGTITWRNAL